jgi:phenylacetate-CoA ligase
VSQPEEGDVSSSLHEAVQRYTEAATPPALALVRQAATQVPALAARLTAAGFDPAGMTDLSAIPVLSKDDVIAAQAADPPFGGMLAPDARVARVFQSPGPLYEPMLDGPDPWRWGPALHAAGFGGSDLALNCFGYHLSPAGAMFDEGARAVGARVVPGGIGNQDLQVRAIADLAVSAYTGLPSYLKALVDRYDEVGLDPGRWALTKAVVTAEPLPDSLRSLLRERVPTVLMAYGTAEAGLIGYEDAPGAGLKPAPGVLVQICSLDTGAPIIDGEGEVVVTLLRPGYPLVRFGTGDLSAWAVGPDGAARLVGVLGRSGAAVKVRGMFLHPRQATAALSGVAGVAAWQFVVSRVDHRDELACEVVLDPSIGDAAQTAGVLDEVRDRVRSGLRFGCSVRAVDDIDGSAVIRDTRNWS